MHGTECRTANRRRSVVMGGLLAVGLLILPASQVQAQDPQPQPPAQPSAPAPPQPAAANPFTFSTDAAMLTFLIKADKAADFEMVMSKLHLALANSDKPERKQQAAGWKLYKAKDPGPQGSVIYVNIIAPVLKGGDYTPSKILAEVLPNEAQELFAKYKDAFAGLSRLELTLQEDFGAPKTASAAAAPVQ
jgi:hypothetical protein